MPKLIPDIENKILIVAENMLFERGYDGLTLKGIAKDCNIAVGTVYNYFPSKEMLVARVMLKDWKIAIDDMQNACKNALDVTQGFNAITFYITEFAQKYKRVREEFSLTNLSKDINGERHKVLINNICEIVLPLTQRFNYKTNEDIIVFLSENLVCAAVDHSEKTDVYIDLLIKTLNAVNKN